MVGNSLGGSVLLKPFNASISPPPSSSSPTPSSPSTSSLLLQQQQRFKQPQHIIQRIPSPPTTVPSPAPSTASNSSSLYSAANRLNRHLHHQHQQQQQHQQQYQLRHPLTTTATSPASNGSSHGINGTSSSMTLNGNNGINGGINKFMMAPTILGGNTALQNLSHPTHTSNQQIQFGSRSVASTYAASDFSDLVDQDTLASLPAFDNNNNSVNVNAAAVAAAAAAAASAAMPPPQKPIHAHPQQVAAPPHPNPFTDKTILSALGLGPALGLSDGDIEALLAAFPPSVPLANSLPSWIDPMLIAGGDDGAGEDLMDISVHLDEQQPVAAPSPVPKQQQQHQPQQKPVNNNNNNTANLMMMMMMEQQMQQQQQQQSFPTQFNNSTSFNHPSPPPSTISSLPVYNTANMTPQSILSAPPSASSIFDPLYFSTTRGDCDEDAASVFSSVVDGFPGSSGVEEGGNEAFRAFERFAAGVAGNAGVGVAQQMQMQVLQQQQAQQQQQLQAHQQVQPLVVNGARRAGMPSPPGSVCSRGAVLTSPVQQQQVQHDASLEEVRMGAVTPVSSVGGRGRMHIGLQGLQQQFSAGAQGLVSPALSMVSRGQASFFGDDEGAVGAAGKRKESDAASECGSVQGARKKVRVEQPQQTTNVVLKAPPSRYDPWVRLPCASSALPFGAVVGGAAAGALKEDVGAVGRDQKPVQGRPKGSAKVKGGKEKKEEVVGVVPIAPKVGGAVGSGPVVVTAAGVEVAAAVGKEKKEKKEKKAGAAAVGAKKRAAKKNVVAPAAEGGVEGGEGAALVDNAALEGADGGATATNPHVCPVANCGKAFPTPHAVKSHLRCHGTATLRCPQCDLPFRRNHDLVRHTRSMHDGGKPHECGDCGRGFARADALRRHRETLSKHRCRGMEHPNRAGHRTIFRNAEGGFVQVGSGGVVVEVLNGGVGAGALEREEGREDEGDGCEEGQEEVVVGGCLEGEGMREGGVVVV
ncbi:hypothetical protein HDU97_008465, partial [Phlyctochytrium planicorne]